MNKVLIYSPTIGRGGVARVVRTLTNTLARIADPAEWSFAVLGQAYDEIGLKVDWPQSWPFEQVEPLAAGEKLPAHPLQFEFLYRQQETFVAHLKRVAGDYNLIYCPSSWWTMRVKDFTLPVPFVTSVPDFAFDMIDIGPMSYYFRNAAKHIAQRADFAVFSSDFQRKHGEQYYGFRKTCTIHHSADFVADHFTPTWDEALRVRAKYALPETYVLAFHPMYHKGISTILEAYEIEGEALPPLVVAGIGTENLTNEVAVDTPSEALRERLKALAERGIKVMALGRVPEEDIAGLYVGATCAIAASTSEGDLSGTVFEAFMASCPLIYSDLEVFTEQLRRDTYGWCFPVGDAEYLRIRIWNVIMAEQEAKRRAMEAFGFANRRRASDVAGEYLQVFREVLRG